MTQGIISNTIVINLGDSLSNINEVKKGLKDVQAALKIMEKEQGRSAMVNGTLMDAKELRNVMQRLQGDIKALQGTPSAKSNALGGLDSEIRSTEGKLRTLQQQLKDIQRQKDFATQAKNTPEVSRLGALETAKFKELMAFQATLARVNSEAKERTATAADKRYYDSQNRRIKENSDNIRNQMTAQVKAQESKFANEQRQIARLTQQYDKLYSGIASSITRNRRLSEEAFNAVKSQASIKASQLSNYGASPMNAGALGNLSYAQYASQFKPSDYQSFQRQIANAKAETERLYQVMTKTNTLQSKIDFANAKRGLKEAQVQAEAFNRSIGQSSDRVGMLGSFMQKFREVLAA